MSFKKKLAKFFRTKGGKATIIGTSIFLLVGIASLVLAYGLKDGWASVLAWFTSRWAMYIYVGIGIWIIAVLYIVYISKKYED